ncbi:hypothetical protein [Metaclostridioides mangenotii]|uniref:hypothetical protein n=1 Tax=Metaclostridioides mangenotii TaxID=1540 RepID=UPI0028E26DB8|nr:hypothetical protein [Clostridioides mangenotii]
MKKNSEKNQNFIIPVIVVIIILLLFYISINMDPYTSNFFTIIVSYSAVSTLAYSVIKDSNNTKQNLVDRVFESLYNEICKNNSKLCMKKIYPMSISLNNEENKQDHYITYIEWEKIKTDTRYIFIDEKHIRRLDEYHEHIKEYIFHKNIALEKIESIFNNNMTISNNIILNPEHFLSNIDNLPYFLENLSDKEGEIYYGIYNEVHNISEVDNMRNSYKNWISKEVRDYKILKENIFSLF